METQQIIQSLSYVTWVLLGSLALGSFALAWLLHKKPVVAPVIGATKIPHLESAVESLSVQLTPEEVAYMEEPYVPHPIVGLIPYGGDLLIAQK